MNRKYILLTVSLLIGSLLIPVGFYVWHFHKSVIGPDPQNWAAFGAYFGGVLNPIISLASLCILGYLTYLVAQQTNKENKKLFILERRMLAYDELTKLLKPINSFMPKMKSELSMLQVYEKFPPEQGAMYAVKVYEELKNLSMVFQEFYYTLFEFNPRYGHLFKYDFNCKEYKDLLSESKRVSELMANLVSDHKNIANLPEKELTLNSFQELVFPVVLELRNEVETS